MSRVAVVRANHEAKRLFNMEPFERDHGNLRSATNGWMWHALTSSGNVDLMAAVSFKQTGAVDGVKVQMFSHPHPVSVEQSLPNVEEDSLPSFPKQSPRPPEIVPW